MQCFTYSEAVFEDEPVIAGPATKSLADSRGKASKICKGAQEADLLLQGSILRIGKRDCYCENTSQPCLASFNFNMCYAG